MNRGPGEWVTSNFITGDILVHLHLVTHTRMCAHTTHTQKHTQYVVYYADNIFKRIFLNKNVWISLKISLKFAPKVWINNIPALVQIMAWHRQEDKPLSVPMMVSLLTHICITRPQWVHALWPRDGIGWHKSGLTLDQACGLMAPSHYLDQCWLLIGGDPRYSSEINFTLSAKTTIL